MEKILPSFILTSLAGLSTIIGYFIIFIKGDKKKIISFSLAFASGIMLTISITDLIPSSYQYLSYYNIIFRCLLMSIFFIIGLIIASYTSKKIDNFSDNHLKKVGIISMIAIILHNIPEGIITFMVCGVDFQLGIKLAIAISLHNIPEGMSIAIPLHYSGQKKIKTFMIVLISGLSEIFGAIITYLFLRLFINDYIIGFIFSLIAGIMINISISELLPESFNYEHHKLSIWGLIIGSVVMIISHFIL